MEIDYEKFINEELKEMGLTDEEIEESKKMCEYMCDEAEEDDD